MISFLSRTIDIYFFCLSLWIYLWLAETSQQPISQTTWLKVTPHCNHCNHFPFLSELMDLFVADQDQSAADQPNNLAEGHPPLYVTIVTIVSATSQDGEARPRS
jgi:hypothetical protein